MSRNERNNYHFNTILKAWEKESGTRDKNNKIKTCVDVMDRIISSKSPGDCDLGMIKGLKSLCKSLEPNTESDFEIFNRLDILVKEIEKDCK